MCNEISLNSADFDEYDNSYGISSPPSFALHFHEVIFSQLNAPYSRKTALRCVNNLSAIGSKINLDFLEKNMRVLAAGGSGAVELDIKWGGRDGVEVNFGGRGEIHDEKGNFVNIKAEQNSDGTGHINISAGHKEE